MIYPITRCATAPSILYLYIIVIWCFDAVQYRMERFSKWLDGVELTIQQLMEESVSASEYHQTLEKFQVKNDCLPLLVK